MSLQRRVQTFVAECPRQSKYNSGVFIAAAKQLHVDKGIRGKDTIVTHDDYQNTWKWSRVVHESTFDSRDPLVKHTEEEKSRTIRGDDGG